MPVTMLLGSFVAGITSEGSGAVAFPVMTLALHLNPQVARDFSIMIQSVGEWNSEPISSSLCLCPTISFQDQQQPVFVSSS